MQKMIDNMVPKSDWKYLVRIYGGDRCIVCGRQFGENYTDRAEAHHVKPQRAFPELANNLDNGVILCHDCHYALHYCKNKKVGQVIDDYVENRVYLTFPKGQKEIIMDYAQSVHGESLNAYINRIINEDMKNHSPEQKAD